MEVGGHDVSEINHAQKQESRFLPYLDSEIINLIEFGGFRTWATLVL